MARDAIADNSHAWSDLRTSPRDVGQGRHSFSGNEPNSVFHNEDGKRFRDVSGVSALDRISDARAIVQLDIDRDGRRDLVFANANFPLLQVFRNRIETVGNHLAIRLVGGNHRAAADSEWSNRDAFGARVRLTLPDGRVLTRELRCGEGLASQNSPNLLFGLGEARSARVEIRWPSGRTSAVERVLHGQQATIYENPAHAPGGEAAIRAYGPRHAPVTRPVEAARIPPPTPGRAAIYVTMATWCQTCKQARPQVAHLARAFAESASIHGVPVDEDDTPEKLETYVRTYRPAYALLAPTPEVRARFAAVIGPNGGLPATVVTDAVGRVRGIFRGVPSASDIARVLD